MAKKMQNAGNECIKHTGKHGLFVTTKAGVKRDTVRTEKRTAF